MIRWKCKITFWKILRNTSSLYPPLSWSFFAHFHLTWKKEKSIYKTTWKFATLFLSKENNTYKDVYRFCKE